MESSLFWGKTLTEGLSQLWSTYRGGVLKVSLVLVL